MHLSSCQVALENTLEMEEENIVNRLQRQLEQLMSNYRVLEQRLEARGLSLRDIGMQPHELPTE
jgi:coiled-coil domain-containing protein 6